eukprot:3221519-Amphidinium_carterae.1
MQWKGACSQNGSTNADSREEGREKQLHLQVKQLYAKQDNQGSASSVRPCKEVWSTSFVCGGAGNARAHALTLLCANVQSPWPQRCVISS